MKRGIVMSRVSTDEQNRGNSPDDQIRVGREYAERNGIMVVAEFREDFSGYEFDRPEFNKIRQMFRDGEADALIVRSGDRLARSVLVAGMMISEFSKCRVELHFVSRGLVDYLSPEGQFIFFMEAAGNGYWGAKAKDAMRNGRKAQIASGIPSGQGRARYGYCKEGKKRETRFVVVEAEAEIVRLIFRSWLERTSAARIATRLNGMDVTIPAQSKGLNRENYRDSGQWTPDMVRNIIKFEGYTGTMFLNREHWTGRIRHKLDRSEWKPVSIPAIIERDVWERAQLQLADGRRIFAPKQRIGEYLMARRLRCECTYSVRPNTCTGYKKKRYYYYTCVSRQAADKHNRCKLPTLAAEQVDAAVWAWIEQMYREPETVFLGFQKAQEEAAQRNIEVDRRIGEVDTEIARQRQRLFNLQRDRSSTDSDEVRAVIKALMDEVVAAIEDGKQRRAVLEKQRVVGPTDAALATVKAFDKRLRKGVENVKTLQDRLEVVEVMNLTGTLFVKDGEVKLRINWWGSDENDEPIHIDSRAAR